jgi:hypothetical protein
VSRSIALDISKAHAKVKGILNPYFSVGYAVRLDEGDKYVFDNEHGCTNADIEKAQCLGTALSLALYSMA